MRTATSSKKKNANVIADELIHLLADTYTLYLKTQNFHWNVTGPFFPQLHALFETQYQELAQEIDVIAERIRSLDSHTPASFAEYQKLASIDEETGVLSAEEMLETLLDDHETLTQHFLIIFEKAEKANDQATVDMLTEFLRNHEKTIWMLKSSL